jgi:hypothetical protein
MAGKRIYRDFTPEEKARIDKLRSKVEKDRPKIIETLKSHERHP